MACGLLLVGAGVVGVVEAAQATEKSLLTMVAVDLEPKLESEPSGPFVVLDPGHGGTNTGAPSIVPNIFEKHLTLALAGEVRALLQEAGFEVYLTRTRDEYLTLRQRGRIANELNADLFVSLHANATESHSSSGYETFILTPEAVDIDSTALRSDSGRARPSVDPKTAALLDDIERSSSQVVAAAIATDVQTNMRGLRGKAGDRGVRQDSMHALLGATMPAILIEIGFIDHPIEGKEILALKLRGKIAMAIADAIGKHAGALSER